MSARSIVGRRLASLRGEIEAEQQVDSLQRGVLWNVAASAIELLRASVTLDAIRRDLTEDEYARAYAEWAERRDEFMSIKPVKR